MVVSYVFGFYTYYYEVYPILFGQNPWRLERKPAILPSNIQENSKPNTNTMIAIAKFVLYTLLTLILVFI